MFFLTSIDISKNHASQLLRESTKDIRGNMLFAYLFATFWIFGAAGILQFFLAIDVTPSVLLLAMISILMLGIIGPLFAVFAFLPEHRALRADLDAGICEKITVVPARAIVVLLMNGAEGIALDCGSHVVVLQHSWWANDAPAGIKWSPKNSKRWFPSSRFSIYRLPRTGRVIAVEVEGEKIDVELADTESPDCALLELEFPKTMDCYFIEMPFEDVKLTSRHFSEENELD